jgi:hypothetical protein
MGLALPNAGSNAGITDLKHPAGNVPLKNIAPDGTGIHDTPVPGTTAVVVQVSPGQHGYDIVRSHGGRTYVVPYLATAKGQPEQSFNPLGQKFEVSCPYRELQAMTTRFFGDAFAGKVPAVAGFKPPVRDTDDDGATDDVDLDPSDPSKK